jgi:anti-anti-sigma factor
MEAVMLDSFSPPGTAGAELTVRVDLVSATITVVGELDRDGVHLFEDAVATVGATLHRMWVLDAAGITFCDAGGLRALAAAAGTARRRSGGLTVTGAGRSLRRLLTLVGLADLLADGPGPQAPAHRPGAAVPMSRPDATAGQDTAHRPAPDHRYRPDATRLVVPDRPSAWSRGHRSAAGR